MSADAALPAALIFDVDGTLAETERDGHRIAFNLAFRQFHLGWHWSPQVYAGLLRVGGGRERILAYIDAERPPLPRPADALAKALHAAKNAHYRRLLHDGRIAFRPGVVRLLHEARTAGLRLAIATTSGEANVRELLRRLPVSGLAEAFEVRICAEQVARKKPDPQVYRLALRGLRLTPDQALAIEDSEPGLAAARGAGLATLVTTSHYTGDQVFDGALLKLPDLESDWVDLRRRHHDRLDLQGIASLWAQRP